MVMGVRFVILVATLLLVSSCLFDGEPSRAAVVIRGTDVSPDRRTLTVWTTYPTSIPCGKQPSGVDVEVHGQVATISAYVARQAGMHDGDLCTLECGIVTQSVTLDEPLADGIRFESSPDAEPGCGYTN